MTSIPDAAFIVGAVIAVLGGVSVFSYLASGSYGRHRCRWAPVAVSNMRGAPFLPEQTAVLKRCARCGDLQATTLVGAWTFAQVLGREAKAAAEAGIAAEGVAG